MQLAKNPVFDAKTKHVEIKYHLIQDMLEDKCLHIVKYPIEENPANLLTKGLPFEWFAHCRALMGVG